LLKAGFNEAGGPAIFIMQNLHFFASLNSLNCSQVFPKWYGSVWQLVQKFLLQFPHLTLYLLMLIADSFEINFP
jgi:hypothetical protein